MQAFLQNIREFPRATTLSSIFSAFLPMLIGYTGPILIVIQAGRAGNLTDAQIASWVWGVVVGNGILGILMSLWFRMPLTAPYSTAGAALLGVSLMNYTLPQAVGAYMVVGLLIAVIGLSGLFSRLVALVPQPIAMGMLAGVLLRFGLDLFAKMPNSPLVVGSMIVTFFLLKRLGFRVPMIGAVVVGIALSLVSGELRFQPINLALTAPIITAPEFNLEAILTLSLPLIALAITSQYIPGQALLKFYGYEPPINRILVITGLGSALVALVGAHGMTLGALTAAFVVSPDAHPDPDKRYVAGVWNGIWHIGTGIFGATVVAFFAGFPAPLVSAIAGLALVGTITSSLANGLAEAESRDATMMAFLCTAANFSLLGIGAPFWGLVFGVMTHLLLRRFRPQPKPL